MSPVVQLQPDQLPTSMTECIPSSMGTPEAHSEGLDTAAAGPTTTTNDAAAAAADLMTQSVKRSNAKRKANPQGPVAMSRADTAAGNSKRLRLGPDPGSEAPSHVDRTPPVSKDGQETGDPAFTNHVEGNNTEKPAAAQQPQQAGEQEEQDIKARDAVASPAGKSKTMLQAVFSPLFSVFRGQGASSTAAAAAAATVTLAVAGTQAVEAEAEASTSAAPSHDTTDKPESKGTSAAGLDGRAHHAHHPPAPEVPEAAESDVDAEADEEEEEEFDPLLFIRSLPPLEQCIPKHRRSLLPSKTRQCKRKTLVLDLDETLVHSTLEPAAPPPRGAEADADAADFSFEVHFNNQNHMIHVRRRPHLAEFMARVASLFEVVVFTASQKVYAEKLLNVIDPKRCLIKHRVFRDSCVIVDGNYLKDLTILGRDMSTTCIIDNSPQAFGFQPDNGIPIESWYDNAEDTELLKLLPFLQSLADDGVEDVRPHIASKFRLKELISNLAA